MALNVKQIQAAKPKEKLYRITDSNGLCLEIRPNGSKLWRYRYRFNGKGKMIGLGSYPATSLKDARDKRDEQRKILERDIDPSEYRKDQQATVSGENEFEAIAREWHTKFKSTWTKGHAQTVIRRLELNCFPWIGKMVVNEIEPPDILKVLRRIESRGALETAHRVRSILGQVLRYAVATGRATRDATADLKGALPPVKHKHMATITDPKQIGPLLNNIDDYQGNTMTKCALQLAPLVFVRPGELRHGEWEEIDFDAAEWRIPAEKMKARRPHIVPLSRQALEVLFELKPLTGEGRYLFPSIRSKLYPMSENTVNGALRRLGYSKEEITGHGFRSMASTNLNENGWKPDVIERQLAHVEGNSVRAAYNHADYLPERRKMMQWWADFLDALRNKLETPAMEDY
ncbi:tyrosine-type recombinase/integrase [Desulfovibrio sp. JC010]|uniref:tyrosine-type recombinase/integrase n=1 Tax=Desulfovibrio sp. JC010 TaxID=2593641 RepID=UPI0013D80ED4|nr:tyrosine-type recombinase/integrase [Desulfovibrio sp. JC010]NDV28802.1 tyrosine-type recombinase/integrase [Desulfovibrio sp. JC010]